MSLAARRQFLATRSIVEVAIRPLKLLTAQANLPCSEPSKATPRGMFWLQPSRGGLAACLLGYSPKWPIEIW
jgi:hypothetical protein